MPKLNILPVIYAYTVFYFLINFLYECATAHKLTTIRVRLHCKFKLNRVLRQKYRLVLSVDDALAGNNCTQSVFYDS